MSDDDYARYLDELGISTKPQICSGCLKYFGQDYEFLRCQKCLEGFYCSEACIKTHHSAKCWMYNPPPEVCAVWCGSSERDEEDVVGNKKDATEMTSKTVASETSLAQFKTSVLAALAKKTSRKDKLVALATLLSDSALDARLGRDGKYSFDGPFVSAVDAECGIGTVYCACQQCKKFAKAIDSTSAKVIRVIDIDSDYNRFEISSMTMNLAWPAVKTLALSRSTLKVRVDAKSATPWVILPDDVATLPPADLPEQKSAEAALGYVRDVLSNASLTNVREIRMMGAFVSIDAIGDDDDAKLSSATDRRFDSVQFRNCKFSSGKVGVATTLLRRTVRALFGARELIVGSLTSIVGSDFVDALRETFDTREREKKDGEPRSPTRITIEGALDRGSLLDLACWVSNNSDAFELERASGTVVADVSMPNSREPICVPKKATPAAPTPIDDLELFGARPGGAEIFRSVSCVNLVLDGESLGDDFPYGALDWNRIESLTIAATSDSRVAELIKFASSKAADRISSRSSSLKSLTVGITMTAEVTISDVAMLLRAWPRLRRLSIDYVGTTLPTRTSLSVVKRRRVHREAEGSEDAFLPHVPLETLSLVPVGDCRDWLRKISNATAKSLRTLKVGFACEHKDSGDLSRTFDSRETSNRFPNLTELAIVRFEPRLPREFFEKTIVPLARAFRKTLESLEVTDVYPESFSSATEGSDGVGWSPNYASDEVRFEKLESLHCVIHNESRVDAHSDSVLVTTRDVCDTAIYACPTISTLEFEIVGPSILVADSRTVGPVPLPIDSNPDADKSPLEALNRASLRMNDQVAVALLGLEFVEIARNLRELDLVYDQAYVGSQARTALSVLRENAHKFRSLSSAGKTRPFVLGVRPVVSIDGDGPRCDKALSEELSIETTSLSTLVYT